MIDFLVQQLILPILEFFYSVTHNYGWAIIFLTAFFKLLLMPLTIKQFRSMRQMQRVQPKLQEIQKKYKDKPEELNKKVMEFYKEHKVNPFGGCLPLLLQMPILIALYTALWQPKKYNIEFTHANSSILGIDNMATMGIQQGNILHWDNIILIILFGITTFISQKMMTTSNDKMQKQMLYTMPLMITLTFVFFPVPSGVLLYLVVSNLITISQNLILLNEQNIQPVPVEILQQPVFPENKKIKEGKDGKKNLSISKSQEVLKNDTSEEPQKYKKRRLSSLNNVGISSPGRGTYKNKKKRWS